MSGLSITLVINPFSMLLIVVGMWSLLQLFGEYGVGGIMLCLALESKLECIKIQFSEFTLVYAIGLPMEEQRLSIIKYIVWMPMSGCEGLLQEASGNGYMVALIILVVTV